MEKLQVRYNLHVHIECIDHTNYYKLYNKGDLYVYVSVYANIANGRVRLKPAETCLTEPSTLIRE